LPALGVEDVGNLVDLLRSDDRSRSGLKGNYLAYDDLAAGLADIAACRSRCRELLNSIIAVATETLPETSRHLERDGELSTGRTTVYTLVA
jgi:hypothetical protein